MMMGKEVIRSKMRSNAYSLSLCVYFDPLSQKIITLIHFLVNLLFTVPILASILSVIDCIELLFQEPQLVTQFEP